VEIAIDSLKQGRATGSLGFRNVTKFDQGLLFFKGGIFLRFSIRQDIGIDTF
jgi:hypothetical protein